MVKKISKFLIVASFATIFFGLNPTTLHAASSAPVTAQPATSTVITTSPPSWFPIVPCGLKNQPKAPSGQPADANGLLQKSGWDYTQDCNQCLLILLGKNLIDFTFFGIVPVVGTLMFLIAGFIILFNARSGKPAGVATGQKIMTDTAIGIAIILGSWLIANFILKSIANDQVASTPWYKIECHTGTLENLVNGTNPTSASTGTGGTVGTGTTGGTSGGNTNTGGGITGTGTTNGTSTQHYSCSTDEKSCISDPNGSYTNSNCNNSCSFSPGGGGASGGGGGGAGFGDVQCLQSGLNLCRGASSSGCANTNCSQYATMIANQATGVATASVLKAFMEVESSCNINPPGGGSSFGLMQMTPPIPQIYASRCGVSSGDVNQAWLTNPINAEKSICISAQWINALAASQCGSSIRNLYAGYNGGQNGACAPSKDCSGQTSCSNEPMKQWECLYNDTAHTQCNGGTDIMKGYNQTRQGATRIQYCATNPGF